MRKILTLPTWLIMQALKPLLPEDHIWKNKNITLSDWEECSTTLNDTFSLIFWLLLVIISLATFLFLKNF